MVYVGVRPRLAHLARELGKRGSYSATYGPPVHYKVGSTRMPIGWLGTLSP
jgi:hypothetical protein